jgi:hypothetical protein
MQKGHLEAFSIDTAIDVGLSIYKNQPVSSKLVV